MFVYAYELLFFIVAFMTLLYDLFFVSTQYVLLHQWLALHFVVNLDNDNKDSILLYARQICSQIKNPIWKAKDERSR